MKSSSSKISVYALIASATGVALFCFFNAAFQATRRASERASIRQELYVNQLTEEWIQGEIKSLTSGQRSWTYFYSTRNTDVLVKRLAGMPEVQSLSFETTDLTDTGVESIASLPNLEKLTVLDGAVGDNGLKRLSQVDSLKTLHLINLDLTDDGLAALQSLTNLETLTVYCYNSSKTKLTDAAIRHLMELRQLKKLNVGRGWLSLKARSELRTVLKDCIIVEDEEW